MVAREVTERGEIAVDPSDESDVESSSESESDALCRDTRLEALWSPPAVMTVGEPACGGEGLGESVSLTASFSDCLRQANQVDQRFFSSALEKNIMVSSSGVCKLTEPSEEQDEPGVKIGRERTEWAVSTGVLGAFARRDAERDLGRRDAAVGAACAEAVELESDLPPRARERAEAKERMLEKGKYEKV